MCNLNNLTVLVTGASKGIGHKVCQELSKAGAKVIAVARSTDELEKLKAECPGVVQTISVDLGNWQDVRKALENVPQLDGLVNNAGVAIIKPFAELTEADFDTTFNVNIKAVFNVTQCLLPKLKDGGSIVMVSSLAASRSFDGHAAYSATKAAVDSLTRSLALELGPRKIRVNSINPTVVFTQMGRENWSDAAKAEPLLKHIPLNRFCEVPEVVDAIFYLLSHQSSFVNAQHLQLDGGYSAS